mmetsp:Transcript_40113/g.52563  ORF Transcript_40113/g.52563 Transcript_40113/m.52563 type:complete len:236 (+) Transcript_40113:394-1101(+)
MTTLALLVALPVYLHLIALLFLCLGARGSAFEVLSLHLALLSRGLLHEHRHCLPLERGLSVQSLDDKVELENEIFVADSGWLARDRVAGPLNDGPVADTVDLAELREHFLHLVEVFLGLTALEHVHDLLDDLTFAVRSSQELIEHFLVALNASFQMLKALLGTIKDRLDENSAVLDDLKKLLARRFGEDGVCNELKLRLVSVRGAVDLHSAFSVALRKVAMELRVKLLIDLLGEA